MADEGQTIRPVRSEGLARECKVVEFESDGGEDGERVRLLPRPRTPSNRRMGASCGVPHAAQGLVQTSCGWQGLQRRHQKHPGHGDQYPLVCIDCGSMLVAKDRSRRILDLRRDGWELENINHRDAAMFCACELRPRVMLMRCTKRSQLEATWGPCRAQETQGLAYVCAFVGIVADDPMTKNMQKSTGCTDTIIRESLPGP